MESREENELINRLVLTGNYLKYTTRITHLFSIVKMIQIVIQLTFVPSTYGTMWRMMIWLLEQVVLGKLLAEVIWHGPIIMIHNGSSSSAVKSRSKRLINPLRKILSQVSGLELPKSMMVNTSKSAASTKSVRMASTVKISSTNSIREVLLTSVRYVLVIGLSNFVVKSNPITFGFKTTITT